MSEFPASRRVPLLALALLAALALGYGLARYTARDAVVAKGAAAESAATPRELALPAEHLKTMNIEVEAARAGRLGPELQAPATITASADGQARITAHASGTVARLYKRIGDVVRAGEVLATLESRDAAAVVAARTAAEARASAAAARLQREQQLFEQKVTARQDLESAQAEAASAQAEAESARQAARAVQVSVDGRSVALVSPIAGRITVVNAAIGAFVAPEDELFRVTDPRAIQVEASLPAPDAAQVSPGDGASVTTTSGLRLSATVRSVTPAVSEQTRSATVLLSVAAGKDPPMPGDIARAGIIPQRGTIAGVLVPEEAVQVIDGRDVVFVRTATGFRVAPVKVGPRSGGQALVIAGLEAGAHVATRNAFLLKAEIAKGAGEDEE